MAAVVAVPVLTVLSEFILTIMLHPLIENTRFEDSNRFIGISIVASLGATIFIFGRFNKLVDYESEKTTD